MIIASFTTVPFALFSLLFAYVSHHICLVAAATSPLYPFLSHKVLRLLSPRDSPDTITTVAGADDTSAGDATELSWELNKDLSCYYVLFLDDQ